MGLIDIQANFNSELQTANDYIEQVCRLFYEMCESKDNLIKALPILYSAIKSKTIPNHYSSVVNELSACIQNAKEQLSAVQSGMKDTEIDISPHDPTADGDLLLYLCSEVSKGEKNRDTLFQTAKGILEALCITKGPLIHGERYYELDDKDDEVYHLVDIALKNEQDLLRIRLERDIASSENILHAVELFNLNNLLNIYRQGFIQVMSYFDTCVFSLVEECMKNDFFFWLDKFDNISIKTHDIAKCSSFDEFRDGQIHSMLKKCYMKDLLSILHSIDSKMFEVNGTDIYAELQEMIGCRNAHIHNKGIVDQAYLDKFNIYSHSLNDYLTINQDYLNRAQTIISELINAIVSKFK